MINFFIFILCRQGPGAEDHCDGPVPQRGLPPPLGRVPHRAGRRAAQGRVGKNPGFFFTQPSVFFCFFFVFFKYIFAQKREFLGFFSVLKILLGASRL